MQISMAAQFEPLSEDENIFKETTPDKWISREQTVWCHTCSEQLSATPAFEKEIQKLGWVKTKSWWICPSCAATKQHTS